MTCLPDRRRFSVAVVSSISQLAEVSSCAHAASRCCFFVASVCLSVVCLSVQNLKNYWSEIDLATSFSVWGYVFRIRSSAFSFKDMGNTATKKQSRAGLCSLRSQFNQSINLLKAKGPNGQLHHSIKYST